MKLKKLLIILVLLGVVSQPVMISASNDIKIKAEGNIDSSFIEEVNGYYYKIPENIRGYFENDFGGEIYISEQDLGEQLGKKSDTVLAYTWLSKRKIFIENREKANKSVIHEMAHVLDYSLNFISRSNEFESIFSEERNNFCRVHKTDSGNVSSSTEYFAEAYLIYVLDPDLIRVNCPKTYNFLEDILKNFEKGDLR